MKSHDQFFLYSNIMLKLLNLLYKLIVVHKSMLSCKLVRFILTFSRLKKADNILIVPFLFPKIISGLETFSSNCNIRLKSYIILLSF